jgi:hypothetical protein
MKVYLLYIYIYREREREREKERGGIHSYDKNKASCARILRNDRFDNLETLKKNRFDEK